MGPADAAKLMGVSEADVIATIEAGDLRGQEDRLPVPNYPRRVGQLPRQLNRDPLAT